ncbi:hypothetical protein K5X82_07990 [Halosquirtibacter xylanolyticus]|uniref:DUF5522 domain-containing protein n=1 Tax=Halosquirtibacter xylanolyticus TaxID=3374599 RepID=UPI0037482620|nr:hypothetical protein K5X82_07990 [Prolixibacteraceae bacterium]
MLFDDKPLQDPLVEGVDYYKSEHGYRVMTETFLIKKGYCCGNGCKHCPYDPTATKGNMNLRDDLKGQNQ